MGGDVRTTVGVPKLSAFANGSGTPLVIDTATGVGYFTDKNTVVPITGGSASGVTSVNGETGAVVIDAADVGAVAKTGDTMTGPLNLAAIQSATGVDAISIAASGVLSFPAMAQSLSSNGYVKLPGGLIIQWGYAPPSGVATQVITFPVPFTQFRSVACQRVGTSTTTVQTGQIISSGLTSFSYFGLFSPVTPTPAVFTGDTTNEFFWIAIGF